MDRVYVEAQRRKELFLTMAYVCLSRKGMSELALVGVNVNSLEYYRKKNLPMRQA